MTGYHFLEHCQSRPLTLNDLKIGDTFICFPDDGDDSGHGGFKGGGVLFVKISPYHPGDKLYHESFRYTCREHERGIINSLPLSTPVLKVVGVNKKVDKLENSGKVTYKCTECRCQAGCACCREGHCGCKETIDNDEVF